MAPLSGSALKQAKNRNKLKCYYQFNQVETNGNITDASGNNNNGKRENFGPDGDAFVTSKGAFAIDFSQPQGESINNLKELDRTSYRIIHTSDEEIILEGNGNGPAELMLDKAEDTFYHSKYNNGQAGFPHSFIIERPYLDKIKAIKITCNRAANYRPISLSVEQSDNMTQWQKLDNMHPFFDMQKPCINLLRPITKRYIKLTFNESAAGGNLLAINNLQFYGEKGNDASNLKDIKFTLVSCSDQTLNKADFAIDGNENTFWQSQDNLPYPHTIIVKTTQKDKCIKQIELIQNIAGNNQNTRKNNAAKVIIYQSNNGTEWSKHEEIRIPYYPQCIINLQKPICKQYVKLEFTQPQYKGSTKLAIKEIKAYGQSNSETYIKNISDDNNNNNIIYNIQGMKTGTDINTLPSGIYIRNGKKFVVK